MNFDRIAPHYQWLEFLFAGPTLQRCRTAWLADEALSSCRSVLIVGEGDGRFLAECAARLPEAEILCVDGSAGMLQAARQRLAAGKEMGLPSGMEPLKSLPGVARIRFQQAVMPDWVPPAGQFDLIVTHFFLDCFTAEDLEKVISSLAAAAKPDAVWLLADFQIPRRPWLARLRARFIVGTAYVFFRLVAGLKVRRLADPQPLLEARGFRRLGLRTWSWGMLHSGMWWREMDSMDGMD
jgi:SAM-dependent methyltransferase